MRNLGWILSFYLDGNQVTSENNRDEFPYLSWSPYDRFDIVEINEFSKFFENQFWNRWDGVAQQMHLIPEYPCEFDWSIAKNNEEKCLINSLNQGKSFALNCIFTTRFSRKLNNTKKLRELVYYEVEKQVQSVYKDIPFEWAAFNSLGAESIVFLALADDIESFAKFGEILKKAKLVCVESKSDLFSTISSFSAFNMKEWSGNPKADLIIRLNLKSKDAYETVIDRLNSEGISKDISTLFLGKCVLDVKVKCREDLLKFFQQPEGIFNGQSDFYIDNISSSRSYWSVDLGEVPSFSVEVTDYMKNDFSDMDNPDRTFESEYPLLQFVLKEYQRLIKSNMCATWASLLQKQYHTVCTFVENYIGADDKRQLYSLLKHLANVLQHIRQASTPVAEVPYHNYTYSGSYNDILKMYYGVITTLFEVGFQMPHNRNTIQHKINFCVDFESTTEIHSTMYSLDVLEENSGDKEERFIVFHLPFNAFSNIEDTVKLLTHEVFHYIAPYDRVRRNKLLIESWTRVLLNRIFKEYDERGISSQLMELMIEQHWNDSELYYESYKQVINVNPAMKHCILNDFIIEGKNLRSLLGALDIVSVNIIHKLQQFLVEKCKGNNRKIDYDYSEKKLEAITNEVKAKIKSDLINKYVQTEIVKNAKAYKEVFCDINMLKIFDMSLEDYVYWFYSVRFRECKRDFIEVVGKVLEGHNIRIMSLELRLCIIFDIFSETKDFNGSYSAFKLKMERLSDKIEEDEAFKKFVEYCDKVYYQYLTKLNLFRKFYKRIINDTLEAWNEIPKKNSNLLEDLQKTSGLNDNIDASVAVVEIFTNKEQYDMIYKNKLNGISCEEIEKEKFLEKLTVYEVAYVSSLGEYINAVCRLANKLKTSAVYGESCWYRGMCSQEYSLLPGLYRLYRKKDDFEQIGMAPYVKQAEILKDAYYLTMNMPSLWTEQLQGTAEHMCCLQHYGMITNLLDFSLDMLVALHFALNPDDISDKEKLKEGLYTPKVVIFNPAKYNKAIMSLEKGWINNKENYKQPSPVMFDVCNEEMSEFFVNDMSAEKFVLENRQFYEEGYMPNVRKNKYPVPVIIRQSNSRILAQNGIFLAYNLYAKVDKNKFDFSYLDLKQIQNSYLALCKSDRELEDEKFLEEVYIDPASVLELQESLKTLGLNTGKMYPELSKIFEQYRIDRR